MLHPRMQPFEDINDKTMDYYIELYHAYLKIKEQNLDDQTNHMLLKLLDPEVLQVFKEIETILGPTSDIDELAKLISSSFLATGVKLPEQI
jgi:hypothetical protein